MLKLLTILFMVTLVACQSVEVNNFVHEESEANRQSLQWSVSKPHISDKKAVLNQYPYIVVDFYQFWPSYNATAFVYVVQPKDNEIKLKSISVYSPDTKEELNVELNVAPYKYELSDGNWLFKYRVIDNGSKNTFLNSKQLNVQLKWSVDSDKLNTKEFILKKMKKNGIAWVT